MPRAAAPRMLLWRPMRFMSRVTICITGSMPISKRILAAAMEQKRTTAVWLSVTFTASTLPFRKARLVPEMLGVGAPGRTAFAGNGLLAALEDLFQFASRGIFGGHCFNSSRVVVRSPPSRLVDQFLYNWTSVSLWSSPRFFRRS